METAELVVSGIAIMPGLIAAAVVFLEKRRVVSTCMIASLFLAATHLCSTIVTDNPTPLYGVSTGLLIAMGAAGIKQLKESLFNRQL